jgi:serine/threonine-protein kinase
MSPGLSVAHYRITAKLGEGGMGEVWRATDTKLGRDVAIKVLPEAFAQDADRMARFEREAQVLAALNHPNIAAIYGVEDRALILELIEGPTLEQHIAQGSVPLDEALPIIQQLIDALEYAHEKGVIHRDLKPANIKLTPERRVKVLDFGLAKALSSDAPARDSSASPTLTMRATLAGVIMGTAAYMAPEQARGHSVDKRADIWAFGAVLYEMLTGLQLFGGPTVSDTLASVLKEEPRFDRVPARLRRLVRVCLMKDPRQRLRDISGARLLLEETPEPTASRAKAPWIVAATLAIVALTAFWMAWRATRTSEHPLMQFSVDFGPDAVAGFRSTAALSPDGTRIVFQSRDADGKLRLSTRLLNQAAATPIPGTENGSEPFFSPAGQWIGFWVNGKLKKVAVSGGAAITLCDASRELGAAWGEDDSIIANLGITGGLFRVPAAGGTPVALTKPGDRGEITHRWPQILPGGQSVLFTAHRAAAGFDSAELAILSLKTGQWKTVHRGGYHGRYAPTGHLIYINQGNLFAVRFDPAAGKTSGSPTPMIDDVAANTTIGTGQFDFSQNGMLVYLRGKPTVLTAPLLWLSASGKTEQLLVASALLDPRLSPDGSKVALSTGTFPGADIAVYNLASTSLTKVTFNSQGNRYPVWAPDGKHILYLSQAGGASSFWWIRTDGSSEPQRLFESKDDLVPASISPDGHWLAYTATGSNTALDIWTLPLDLSDPEHPKAGTPEPFLHSPATEAGPAFSPDGRWLAYTSSESSSTEVYVRPFRPQGQASGGKWQISAGGGGIPVWSRDGHRLFYQTQEGYIMVADDCAAEGESFTHGKVRKWYDKPLALPGLSPIFDVAPGGSRLLVVMRPTGPLEAGTYAHITVLLNFFDELRRRVP